MGCVPCLVWKRKKGGKEFEGERVQKDARSILEMEGGLEVACWCHFGWKVRRRRVERSGWDGVRVWSRVRSIIILGICLSR